MIRPIFCFLNIYNLKNNLFLINNLSLNNKVWIVLKGNAYGHGIKNIYKYIYKKVDGFAIVSLKEAILLRNLGFKKDILLLEGFFDLEDIKLCFKLNLTVVIHSNWQIKLLNSIIYNNKKINIYLKFNNDLNRLGFSLKEIYKIFNKLKYNKFIKFISLIFHLAKSGQDDSKNNYLDNYLRLKCLNFKYISIFSSSGLIWHINNIYTDWVRIGILLYGVSPTDNFNDIKKYGFKPVMNFFSKIICIRKISCGKGIGYNHSFIAYKNMLIGIVACGYADGYPRNLSNKSFVLINGYIKAKIIGFISMDMMIIDLLNNKNIKIGSYVELWGENIYINNVAKLCNTISYELMCSINSKRVSFICKNKKNNKYF